VEITIEIHDDNVFCTCPGCGCEVEVDLAEVFSSSDSEPEDPAEYDLEAYQNKVVK
jgi:hypothetical protein